MFYTSFLSVFLFLEKSEKSKSHKLLFFNHFIWNRTRISEFSARKDKNPADAYKVISNILMYVFS